MRKLKSHTVEWAQIERFLASAEKKLASAYKILVLDEEACLEQADDQPGHHIAVIEFVRQRIDQKHAGLVTVFDRLGKAESCYL